MIFKNLKLITKQILGFGLIIFVMIGGNIFMLIEMTSIKSNIDNVTSNWMPGVIAISEFAGKTATLRIYELQHVTTESPEEMQELEKKMRKIKLDIQKLQNAYEEMELSAEERLLYESIEKKWRKYIELDNEFLQLSRYEMKEEAVYMLNHNARDLFYQISNELNQLIAITKNNSIQAAQRADKTYAHSKLIMFVIFGITVIMSIIIGYFLVRTITYPLKKLERAAESVATGNDDVTLNIQSEDEIGNLASSFNRMTRAIREAKQENVLQDWLKTGQNMLNEKMRGDQDLVALSKNVITYLCKYLDAQIGALYLYNHQKEELKLTGSYAFNLRKSLNTTVKVGDGLIGQAAYEQELISINDIPEDYIRINSALGEVPPRQVVAVPFLYESRLEGVMEFGTLYEFSDKQLKFLKNVTENIAIGFNSANSRKRINVLLQESQEQAEELKKRQEELERSNRELEAQTNALKESESELQAQQEELRATNEELEEKTRYLEKQRKEISEKNNDLEIARKDIEQKAKELEITSKYKSEFLANMSHELRTPLNSLLILARNLYDNRTKNLTEEQLEAAQIIYKSGNDLLALINDILDLSKIEAGKMNINIENINIQRMVDSIENTFRHMIEQKKLEFRVKVDEQLPKTIDSDPQRIEQIIKNLMSNAVKFTKEGFIELSVEQPDEKLIKKSKLKPDEVICLQVEDSGIGIPKEKQLAIFEAFQQADGSTSRKYGGTGLGLSISKQLVTLLGGEFHLISQRGEGSKFSIILPRHITPEQIKKTMDISDAKITSSNQSTGHDSSPPKHEPTNHQLKKEIPEPFANKSFISDDRGLIHQEDKVILVIEDDPSFAKILLNQCHEKGFKCIATPHGETGLDLAGEYKPAAIILDIKLPGISGWQVLDALKSNPDMRHIPVHMMSVEEASLDAMKKGAIGFLTKPVHREQIDQAFVKLEHVIEKEIKDLLVVEDDEKMRNAIVKLIKDKDVKIIAVDNGKQACELIENHRFDCMVLDLGLPDVPGIELLNRLSKKENITIPPVIVYTGKEISPEEHRELEQYADSIIIKGVKSEERLLDETALFLHRVVSDMPSRMQEMIVSLHDKDAMFRNKKVLLVDDDMRNVFALSKILQEKGMKILKAEDGKKALQILSQNNDIDLVLMDIMMPVMDGYKAMREIRKMKNYKNIPVIALTAKAMKEDRQKCIEAGASDYLPKPVDIDRLVSMMRVWLYQ